jgi:hypothetical protein
VPAAILPAAAMMLIAGVYAALPALARQDRFKGKALG